MSEEIQSNQVDEIGIAGLTKRRGFRAYESIAAGCRGFWERRGMQEPGLDEDLVAHWLAKKAGRK
jgi:hypothetical protein